MRPQGRTKAPRRNDWMGRTAGEAGAAWGSWWRQPDALYTFIKDDLQKHETSIHIARPLSILTSLSFV